MRRDISGIYLLCCGLNISQVVLYVIRAATGQHEERLELATKVREDFMKAPSSAFIFKALFRHFDKQAPKLGKYSWVGPV